MEQQSPANRCTVTLAMLVLFGGCSWGPPQPASGSTPVRPAAEPAATLGQRAASVAVAQLGTPYRYGGSSERGFDCSGLVHYAYARAGGSVPRTTGGLWRGLPPVDATNLRAGDVLFFDIEGKVSHVGLYLGQRRFVHAPATGRAVSIESLDSDFYRQAFVRAGRPY